MAVFYDPEVIQQFATDLYRRARTIVMLYTLCGLAAPWAAIAILYFVSPPEATRIGLLEFMIVSLIGAGPGYILGRTRAFAYKFQAQTALVQVEIERHLGRIASSQTSQPVKGLV